MIQHPSWTKVFWILANGALLGAVFYFPKSVGLKLIEPWGWIAVAVVMALGNWYAVDWIYPRRQIYRFFGRSEPVLSHRLRFVRQMALFATLIIAVAVTLVALQGESDNTSLIPSDAATPLAGITTAFLASVGWLYTRFEQEKADRARATQEAFKRFYGDTTKSTIQIILDLTSGYRGIKPANGTPMLGLDAIDLRQEINTNKGTKEKVEMTLRDPLNRLFNELNQIAFGVRQGELDYNTVEMIMRPRYLQYAYVFFEYIAKATAAEPQPNGRWRAQNRIWEHMLWLTSKLPMLASDGTDWEHIVMPPDHIIGIRPGELVRPPKSDHRHPLLPDLAIVSDAWKRQEEARLNAVFPRIPPR